MKKILLSLLFVIINLSTAIDIYCNLNSENDFYTFSNIPECEIDNDLIITTKTEIWTTIYSSLETTKVQSFVISVQIVYFLPTGLEIFFPDLLALTIYETGLKEIKKNDLDKFEELKYLNLDSNDLEIIEKNLFEGNMKLEVISIQDNLIKIIKENSFDDLTNLSYLLLEENLCVSKNVENDTVEVQLMIKDLNTSCC